VRIGTGKRAKLPCNTHRTLQNGLELPWRNGGPAKGKRGAYGGTRHQGSTPDEGEAGGEWHAMGQASPTEAQRLAGKPGDPIKWAGGRIQLTGDGRKRWMLVRQIAGKRWYLTLNVTSEQGALAELALFNRDPGAYIEARQHAKARMGRLGSEEVRPQSAHLEEVVAFVGGSDKHQKDTRRYLAIWLEELGSKADLRSLGLAPLVRVLDKHCRPKQKSKRNKLIVALLNWCRLLESRGLLDPAQSPGRWLSVVPTPPAKVARKRHHGADVLEAC